VTDELELSIVMPCLNEAETLKTCIDKARAYLERSGIKGEVVIGDNGSTDGSQQIARDAGARVVDVPQRGYGAALIGAIEGSRARYVIMGDSDDSYDFSNLDLFVAKLREGYDLVMGNRFKGGIKPGAMPFLHRYLGNPVLSFIGRVFFPSAIGDFHCGLRGFRQDIVRRIGLRTTGMEFASEMVVKSTLFQLKVCEVPTTLSPDGRSRPPHLRTWRDGWRHLRFLLIYSPRWLYLIPGVVMILIGLGVGAAVLPGPLKLGGVTLDTNTLLYCGTFVIIGFLAVIFGFLTRVYGMQAGFLPKKPFLERLTQKATLEWGVLIGLAIFLIGVAGSLHAVVQWDHAGFARLAYPEILRVVIPSVVAIILGFQIVLSAFFLSVLSIGHR